MANQSRRKFLKLVGITAASAAASSCLPRRNPEPIPYTEVPLKTPNVDKALEDLAEDLDDEKITLTLYTNTRKKYKKVIYTNTSMNREGVVTYRAEEQTTFEAFDRDTVVKRLTATIDLPMLGKHEVDCPIPETRIEKGATLTLRWGNSGIVSLS